MGGHSVLQRIFPTQESNRGLLQCRQILYQLTKSSVLIISSRDCAFGVALKITVISKVRFIELLAIKYNISCMCFVDVLYQAHKVHLYS